MRPPFQQSIADVSSPYRSPALIVIVAGTLTVFLIGLLATLFNKPFMVPPVGPTIFILIAFPLAQEAQPRNVICGHAIGIAAGAVALAAFGLLDTPPDLNDLGSSRLFAVTLAMAVSLAALTSMRVLHIPAVATALLIALGLLRTPEDWAAIMIGVLIAIAIGLLLARGRGVPMPFWSRSDAAPISACEAAEPGGD